MSKVIHSERLDKDFDVDITHAGLMLKDYWFDKPWPCDHWVFVVEGVSFDYYVGIGQRKKLPGSTHNEPYNTYDALMTLSTWTQDLLKKLEKVSKIKAYPPLDDLLHCLVSDASLATETFDDWCGEFGYDTDSRRAMATYEECQKTIGKLRNIGIIDLQAATEAFQDY